MGVGTGWCGGNVSVIEFADTTGNGFPDLICMSEIGNYNVYRNDGVMPLINTGKRLGPWCNEKYGRQWADIDGDGVADLTCNSFDGRHFAKLSDGKGGFKRDYNEFVRGWCGGELMSVHYADLDGDGKADLICSHSSGNHNAFLVRDAPDWNNLRWEDQGIFMRNCA